MNDTKTVLVVTGNKKEFEYLIIKFSNIYGEAAYDESRSTILAGDTKYIYVAGPDYMRGYHGVKVEFQGTYAQRPDIDKILEMVPVVERE